MNNTLNNVPRELLERITHGDDRIGDVSFWSALDELRAILSAPSPTGAGGLEVAGYLLTKGNQLSRMPAGAADEPLCRLSDAQAIIDGLRGEVEVMTQHANNYSRMFEECAEERDQQAQRIGELRGEVERLRAGAKDLHTWHLVACEQRDTFREQRDQLAALLKPKATPEPCKGCYFGCPGCGS